MPSQPDSAAERLRAQELMALLKGRPGGSPLSLTIQGRGGYPHMEVKTRALNMGSIMQFCPTSTQLRVYNHGNADAMVTLRAVVKRVADEWEGVASFDSAWDGDASSASDSDSEFDDQLSQASDTSAPGDKGSGNGQEGEQLKREGKGGATATKVARQVTFDPPGVVLIPPHSSRLVRTAVSHAATVAIQH